MLLISQGAYFARTWESLETLKEPTENQTLLTQCDVSVLGLQGGARPQAQPSLSRSHFGPNDRLVGLPGGLLLHAAGRCPWCRA